MMDRQIFPQRTGKDARKPSSPASGWFGFTKADLERIQREHREGAIPCNHLLLAAA